MMHLSRLTVANLVLVVALVLAAAALLLDPSPSPTLDDPGMRTVTDVDPAQVKRIRLSLRQGDTVELLKQAQGWRIASPIDLATEADHVQALLEVLRARSDAGFRAAGNDLALFGLEPPLAVMETDGVVIAFGDTEPVDGRRYLLTDGEVHIVAEEAFRFIERGVAGLATTSPMDGASSLEAISIPGLAASLVDGRWTVTTGEGDESSAKALVASWRDTRAQRVSAWSVRQAPGKALGEVVLQIGSPKHDIRFQAFEDEVQVVLVRPDIGLAWHFTRRAGGALLGRDPSR